MSSKNAQPEDEWLELKESADVAFWCDAQSEPSARRLRWELLPLEKHPSDLTFRIVIPSHSKE